MANLIGQRLGQYEITALLGKGGMATVYRARQTSMDRDVAIKVIKPDLAETADFVTRFQREAITIASLSHANILKVFDYGQHGDLVYLVMELLSGGSLSELVRKGPLPLDRVSKYLEQIASALDYAHGKGIVHRDLKPQNVLLDETGAAHLSDFGLVKILGETSALTATGIAMGTPAYMPPEQWQGRELDARADIYALGVMLFEMLTGRLPFQGDTPFSMMTKHVNEAPPAVRPLRGDVPAGVEAVIRKALAKDPGGRYQSAGTLAEAFKSALAKSGTTQSTAAGQRRGANRVLIIGVVMVAVVVIAAIVGQAGRSAQPAPNPAVIPTTSSARSPAVPTTTGAAATRAATQAAIVAPTKTRPTVVPALEVSTTVVPPTVVPPTKVSPTQVPPTLVPPTQVPPTNPSMTQPAVALVSTSLPSQTPGLPTNTQRPVLTLTATEPSVEFYLTQWAGQTQTIIAQSWTSTPSLTATRTPSKTPNAQERAGQTLTQTYVNKAVMAINTPIVAMRTPSLTLRPSDTFTPTFTGTPTSTLTPTLGVFAAAQATNAFELTVDAIRTQIFVQGQTATAKSWTATPTRTLTFTPSPTVPSLTPSITFTPSRTYTPTMIPTPSIALYDDFKGANLNLKKWYLTGSSFSTRIVNGGLYFRMTDWLNTNVRNVKPMREISVLLTLEEVNKADGGVNFTVLGSTTYTMALAGCTDVYIFEIAKGRWTNESVYPVTESDCPSTHLLGVSVDGTQAHFYIDGKQVGIRPMTGNIQQAWFGGWAPNPAMPTVGRAQGVWINFVQ